jgi:transposase InsO family protein
METMKSEYPIAAMTDALEVSRSGFFAHQRKGEKPRRQEDRALAERIRPIFGASRQTYGSPRITAALRQAGQRCGKNRVARLMRENPLRPRQKRRRWRPVTTESNHRQPVAENWLATVPAPARPDQVLRCSAWIWVFSSQQSTNARSGGSRYNPMTSQNLASKSGSLESLKTFVRCGLRSFLTQSRYTVAFDTPWCWAMDRTLQRATPGGGWVASLKIRRFTAAAMVGLRPRRGRSRNAPSRS